MAWSNLEWSKGVNEGYERLDELLETGQVKEHPMGKVVFNMTMSLDGFVAGANDSPENGLGDGGDALFNWYFSGTSKLKISEGTLVLKVSQKSAEIHKEGIQNHGAGVWGRRTLILPAPGADIPRDTLLHPHPSPPAGMGERRLAFHVRHGWG